MFGRRRPIPELKSAQYMQRQFGERVAMNSPIQGTAADIMKIAMIRVDERLRKEKLESRVILQVHDELLVEAKKEEVEEVKQILTEEMRGAADLKVPLEIDLKTGMSWFERSEEHTSELQSRFDLVCRLLLEKKKSKHSQ